MTDESSESRQRKAATAAPADLTFLDGTSYKMTPFSDVDIAELDWWVQQHYIKMMRASIPEDATEEEANRIERMASQEALGLTWLSGAGASLMATVTGMSRLVLQAIKKEHPDVKVEDIRKHMLAPVNIDEARKLFHELNIEPIKMAKKGARRVRRPNRRRTKKKPKRRRKR
jgi:hypothetical protein